MFFKTLLLFTPLFLVSFPAFGFIEKLTCSQKMPSRYRSLLRGTITYEDRRQFFLCIQDALKLSMKYISTRKDYTTEDITKFYYHVLDYPVARAWEMASKTLVIKKILLGGRVDRLEGHKIEQLTNLISKYQDFFAGIKEEVPLFLRILSGSPPFISFDFLDKSVKKLHSAVRSLGEAYRGKGVSYTLSDFRQIPDYARILSYTTSDFTKILRYAEDKGTGHVTLDFYKTIRYANALGIDSLGRKKGRQLENLSSFLYFWGTGVFSGPIEGRSWNYFTGSFNHIISLFIRYQVYIAGRDVFNPRVFSVVLKSIDEAIDAIMYVRYNPSGKGFPASHLEGLIRTVLSQADSEDDFSESPLSHLVDEKNKDSLSFIIRALICFSLPPVPSDCKIISSQKKSEPFLSFLFPDGKYLFQRNDTRKWVPSKDKVFSVIPDQLQSLKNWLGEFRYWINFMRINGEAVANYYGFSHWLNGFFGQDREKRIRFDYVSSAESEFSLFYSLLNYSAFLKFFISPYLKLDSEAETLSIGPSDWARFTEEMLPVLAVLFQINYNDGLKKLSPVLFEYGDLLLNSSNKNGKLEVSEVLDLTMHLSSAQQSSYVSFSLLKKNCGELLENSCISEELFFNPQILDNFPHFQKYFLSVEAKDFIFPTRELLPATVQESYELLPFFLIVQLTELLFHKYDFNKSLKIELQEFQELTRGLVSKMTESIPHLNNKEHGERYLRYAMIEGNFPFLMEKGDIFSSIKFTHWVMHPKEYEDIPILKYQLFVFLVNLYNLGNRFN